MANPDRSFLDASISELIKKLTIDEKISLLGAPNWWNTNPIQRLGIPSIRMSDGPNGVRGSSHFVSTPSQCLPCATSLASTFDKQLIYDAGVFLAKETKAKSSVVLLAPTCNIPRSPLGGRAFESFSEDPHLSGVLASAYVNGLQSEGVSATIKHFVANDQEHERTAADSVVSDRALREIYLYPFMLAQAHARPGAFMTSYGRLGGLHCSENPFLLQEVLRNEWKFKGVVISDWFGTYAVAEPINAGLDLEMPGPPRWRTPLLMHHSLTAQKLSVDTINERVTALLKFIQRQARSNPDVVYGDGVERSRDSPEGRLFCRKLASEGMVLLKNENQVLPIASKVKKIAVIGAHAQDRVISGGGSAALKPTYVVTPWQGIVDLAPEGTTAEYSVGCYSHKYLPTLEANFTTPDGKPGWLCTFYNQDEGGHPVYPIADFVLNDTRVKLNDFLPEGLNEEWTIKLKGKLKFPGSGTYELGLTVAGRAKLFVNGKLTIDNWTKQTPGDFFYGQGTIEEKATIDVEANVPVDVVVEYTNTTPPPGADDDITKHNSQPALMRGVRLGGCPKIDPDVAIREAVDLASKADLAIFVGGLTPEWESEGFDRPSLELPGRQDEVIARVSEANPNTVVCIQAGSAISMPWVDKVNGVIQSWYSGNEVGNSLADILYGKVNPAGKLPLTLPVRIEDTPSYLSMHSENGKIHYREDLFVGYKHYQARGIKPLFPFGFGLSYTKFELFDLSYSLTELTEDENIKLNVSVSLTNVGPVVGSEVAQVYIAYPQATLTHPSLQLKGFEKAKNILPGSSATLTISLDKYAVSYWDDQTNRWTAAEGEYGLRVGTSSEDIVLEDKFRLTETFRWRGL